MKKDLKKYLQLKLYLRGDTVAAGIYLKDVGTDEGDELHTG